MKTKTILFFLLALLWVSGWGQPSISLVNKKDTSQTKLEVKKLSFSRWNAQDGIPYKQGISSNLGPTSFEILDENRVVFLCNATNEIIITDKNTGRVTKKFPVIFAPRDFSYDNGFFYVLEERHVIVYDTNGKESVQLKVPNPYLGTERLARFGNATYLLLPGGNSLKIESDGLAITPQEYEGWITATGDFIKTINSGHNSFLVKVILSNGKRYVTTLTADKKIAGVYVVGSTKNRVVLDVQTYITESPIAVDRVIVFVDLQENGLGAIISSIKVPNCYYVHSNKNFYVSENGTILNMITSPQGVIIYSLIETKTGEGQDYPDSIKKINYHYNDHLIKINEK